MPNFIFNKLLNKCFAIQNDGISNKEELFLNVTIKQSLFKFKFSKMLENNSFNLRTIYEFLKK